MSIIKKIKKIKSSKVYENFITTINETSSGNFNEVSIDLDIRPSIIKVISNLSHLEKNESYPFFIESIKKEKATIVKFNLRLLINYSGQYYPFIEYKYIAENLYDEIKKTYDDNIPINSLTKIIEIIEKIFSLFEEYTQADTTLAVEGKLISSYLKNQEIKINQLENILEKQILNIGEQAKKWNELSIEFQKNIQLKYDEDLNKIKSVYNLKEQDLIEKEIEFQNKVAQFDLRERTAVRRGLLSQIKELIKNREVISLSNKTSNKRNLINLISLSILMFSGLGIFSILSLFYVKYNTTGEFSFPILYPLLVLSPIFISILIFFIRWHSSWYNEHANVEFSNIKFESDILRASWIAELYFELKEEKGVELPVELLNSFTKGLFENTQREHKIITHPFEDIIKNITNLKKFKVDRNSIELENKE